MGLRRRLSRALDALLRLPEDLAVLRAHQEALDRAHERTRLQVSRVQEVLATATREALLGSAPRYQDPRHLAPAGFRVHSQNDEDGMLEAVFERIGTGDRRFLEVGAGAGSENNTAYLLLKGWTGVWIEADPGNVARIRKELAAPLAEERLVLIPERATTETLDRLVEAADLTGEIDLLSLDVDGNDYWLWEALTACAPRAVIVEYNAQLGPTAPLVQPYDPDHRWDGTSAYGASLSALVELGAARGYRLVGCDLMGVNALFVREELCADHFLEDGRARAHFEPPRYLGMQERPGHPRRFGAFERPG